MSNVVIYFLDDESDCTIAALMGCTSFASY
jgi:hypothetical protein